MYQCLYVIREEGPGLTKKKNTHHYKIGICLDGSHTQHRLMNLQIGNPHRLTFERIYFVPQAADLERELHQEFTLREQHIQGEWFKLYDRRDLNYIDRLILDAGGRIVWDDAE